MPQTFRHRENEKSEMVWGVKKNIMIRKLVLCSQFMNFTNSLACGFLAALIFDKRIIIFTFTAPGKIVHFIQAIFRLELSVFQRSFAIKSVSPMVFHVNLLITSSFCWILSQITSQCVHCFVVNKSKNSTEKRGTAYSSRPQQKQT